MSLPSVRSSSTLTPIENLDNLECVPPVTQANAVPPNLTDPSLNAIFVHTKDKAIVDDIVSPQTDNNSRTELGMRHLNGDTLQSEIPQSSESVTEPEMINSLKTRIILPSVLKNAWNINKQADFTSDKRTGGPASPTNDSFPGPDVTFNVGSDRDNKDSVKMSQEEVEMKDNDEDGNENKTIADDKENARKQTAIDEHESTMKRTSHIIDGAESSDNYSENIFDTDFYDDVNGNDNKAFSVDESFLEPDVVSNHSRRVSVTSDSKNLFKTEPVKSKRSSVYYETNNSPEHNLQATSRETTDEKSMQVTKNEHRMSSKSQEDTSLDMPFEAEDNGEKITHSGGSNQQGFTSKEVEDDIDNNDKENNQEAFYLDMVPNNKVNTSDGDIIHKYNVDSNSGDIQSEMYLNNNSELFNKNRNDKSTTKANIKSDKEDIQRHATANIQLGDSTEEQIKAVNTVGLSYIESRESTDVQSIDPGENVHDQRDTSIKHLKTWTSVDQNDSSHKFNVEPIEQEKDKENIISADDDDDDKHTIASTEEENRERSLTNGSDVRVEPNESNLPSVDHTKQEILTDATHPLKTMSEVNVHEKENITEERKDDMYSKYERVKGKEDSKTNSKSRTNDQSVKNLKPPSEASQKQPMSNRQSNYKSIVEMKALDRLLTGPYSENLSKKTPSPRRGTYSKTTKASSSRIHKQDRYIKLADVEGDNNTSKSATAETKDRVNSSRKLEGSNKATGSAKSNTNSSKSIFTEPFQEARPVKAVTDRIADNKTVPDETNKRAVSSHQEKYDQIETKTEMRTTFPVSQSEKHDLFEPLITYPLEQAATIERVPVSEVEKNTTRKEDKSVVSAENMVTSVPENTVEKNMELPNQDEHKEVHDNDNSFHAEQEELVNVENPNLDDGFGEHSTRNNKTAISETGNKLTQERDWSMARTKFKALLPNLVKTPEAIQNVRQRNEDQSLDATKFFTKTNKDTQEAVESAVMKRDEPTNPKSQDAKDTVASATKELEEPSNYKSRDTKTVGSATKKREETSNSKTRDTKVTKGSVIKKTEEPLDPKTRDTKIEGSAAKKREESSYPKTQDAKEAIGSATKKKEEPSIPVPRDVKQTVGSATKKRELSNPKTKNINETEESAKRKAAEPTTGKTQDTKETMGSATQKRDLPNPKIRDTKETLGSATNKRELPKPKNLDTKEAVESTTKKTDETPNTKTRESGETNKLMKKIEEPSITNNQDTNETTEPDMEKIKESLVTETQDIKETSERATLKTEAPSAPTDQLVTPPASIVIVDETGPPQTKTNFLIDQVIMQDILQNYKTKPKEDSNNSTNAALPNSSLESPSHEPLIGNGVSKYQDRNPSKSVSIHSLTVPGLQSNPFTGDLPLDEDNISIYSRRDSVRQSFDSGSRKSVDYRIRNTALVVLPTTDEKPKSVLTNEESFIKNSIPFLPMKMAVICLILNIFVPGSGTALSGLAILCCGQPRVLNKDDQILITLCANCMVGLAQLCTITFLLVGWFWSVIWGIEMVILSVEHEKNLKELRNKEMQSLALNAFGSPKRPVMFGT